MMRLRVFLCVTAAIVLAWPGVAHAKGPQSAELEADGLVYPINVSGPEGGSSDFGQLVDQSGFFPALFGQTPDPMLDAAPTTDLGPAYVLTWRMPSPTDTPDVIRMTLYLDAAGGPLTYTEAGQLFYGTEHARGGWYKAPAALAATIDHIVRTSVSPKTLATVTATTLAPAPVSTTASAADGNWWWVAVALAALVLAGGGAATYSRRRVRVSPA
jgi:hypothetical protein